MDTCNSQAWGKVGVFLFQEAVFPSDLEHMYSRDWLPVFEPWLCHWLAVWPPASYLTSLSFNFLICKVGYSDDII